jgi:biotin operon repressor
VSSLSPLHPSETSRLFSRRQRTNVSDVLRELEQLHSSLRDGDGFPSRRELVEQFDTSERAVREALEQLERQGKIIRRVGRGGSVVTKLEPVQDSNETRPNGTLAHSGESGAATVHPVLAIGEPDGGVFDQAMRVLMKQAKGAKLTVNCRFITQDELDHFVIPPLEDEPRRFVVFRWHFLPLAKRLHEAGHRVVFIGTLHADDSVEIPNVSGDQEHGGFLTVQHLLELGHRHIAFHVSADYPQLRRWEGWQRAMEEARECGLNVQSTILDLAVNWQWRQRDDLVRAYFSRPDAPTAIVSWNDDSAAELLTLLLRSGVRVPEDVSLIGYDNLRRGAELHPALSTVDGALDIQIQAALRLLKQRHLIPTHQTIVVPTVVPRESTSAPRFRAN